MKLKIIQSKCALSFHILYIIIYYYEMKAPKTTPTKSIDLFIEVISMALFLFYQRKKKFF